MKNLAKIFMAVILLAAYSCTQDTTVDEGGFQPTEVTKFVVAVENARTTIGDKNEETNTYPVYWSEGDQISLNGITSAALAGVPDACTSATFEFAGDLGGTPYKVSYPATEVAGQVTFASVQNYVPGSFDQNAAPMYGEGDGTAITMHMLASVLQFPVVANEGETVTLKMATISNSADNGKLAGTYDVSLETIEDEVVCSTTATDNATTTIHYNFGEGLTLSTTPTNLHIAIPAGIYENLKVTLVSTDNKVMEFSVSAPATKPFEAGKVHVCDADDSAIIFTDNGTEFQITDSASLMEFATLVANGEFEYSRALVMNDIAFDSATYTWAAVNNFEGIFDGQGYTISGLTAPMFDVARATIQNLKLNSTVEGALTGNVSCGLLANHFTGIVRDVEVSGSLTITSSDTDYASAGGVIGKVANYAELTNVVNKANVTVTATARFYAAGVVGSGFYRGVNFYLRMTNCHNEGAITDTADGSGRRGIAGLIGATYSFEIAELKSCSNKGAISCASASTDTHVAGLIATGFTPSEIIDCSNSGTVTVVANATRKGDIHVGGATGYQPGIIILKNFKNLESGIVSCEDSAACGHISVGGAIGYFTDEAANSELTNVENYALIHSGQAGKNVYHGGVIGRVLESTAKMTNLVNYADIVFSGVGNSSSYLAGGVIGSFRGNLYSATNHGNLTMTGSAVTTLYFAGVVGYTNNTASKAYSLTNKGKIIYEGAAGTNAYIGGINGNNQAATEPSGRTYSLVNEGDLEVGGTAGGMYYIGGCSGTTTRTAKGLFNSGKVTFTGASAGLLYVGGCIGSTNYTLTPAQGQEYMCTNEGDMEVGGTAGDAFYIAGCIANSTNNMQGLYNSGNISVTTSTSYAATTNTINVGGAVGYVAGASKALKYIKNVKNTGNVTYNGVSTSTTTNLHIAGGIGGVNFVKVDGVENTGIVTIGVNADTADGAEASVAGCLAWIYYGSFDNSVNGSADDKTFTKGTISIECKDKHISYYAGGCSGYLRTYFPSDSNYKGDTAGTHTGHNNYGTVRTTETLNAKNLRMAGLCGWIYYSPSSDLHNYAPVIIRGTEGTNSAAQLYLGGITGRHNASSSGALNYSNLSNSGDIDVDIQMNAGASCEVGGIFGTQERINTRFSNVTNSGNITISERTINGRTGVVSAGGIISAIGQAASTTITNATNTGNITILGTPNSSKTGVGGIVGYINITANNKGVVATTPITESLVDCDIVSASLTAGMVAGKEANEVLTVASTQVAGSITNPGAEKVTLDATNFYQYIYTTVPEGWTADSCNGNTFYVEPKE